MKPHKWAKEIHAIADGIDVQWAWESRKVWSDWDREYDASPITSREGIIWRIKPPEVDQWRKDMAKALNDGNVVEFETPHGWDVSIRKERDFLDPSIRFDGKEYYRIKPEKKPDVVMYMGFELNQESSGEYVITTTIPWASNKPKTSSNLKLILDGETGKLKDSEVLE